MAVKKVNNSETKKTFTSTYGLTNYILMAVGIVVLIIGYILLSGGGSDDPNVFNEAMFDKRRLVAAPITITLGLVIEVVAIMMRPKDKKANKEEEEEK
ncbi:MAG: DUF3098 domain-containing protein [Bacteroidales bacterium]|nr:DUF3098 domain-containing protein [Bacteroidales bacterium]